LPCILELTLKNENKTWNFFFEKNALRFILRAAQRTYKKIKPQKHEKSLNNIIWTVQGMKAAKNVCVKISNASSYLLDTRRPNYHHALVFIVMILFFFISPSFINFYTFLPVLIPILYYQIEFVIQ
jgi:hypothetical protein